MGWVLTALSMATGWTAGSVVDTAEDTFWTVFRMILAVVGVVVAVLLILWKSGFLPAYLATVGKAFAAIGGFFR